MSKKLRISPIKYWYLEKHIKKMSSDLLVKIYDLLELNYNIF